MSVMRLPILFMLITALIAPTGTTMARPAQPQQQHPGSFADLTEELLPSVVNISSSQKITQRRPVVPDFGPGGSPFDDFFREFFEGHPYENMPRNATSLGSGFILDAKEGYVVTNNHVITGADEITVILQNDVKVPAEVIGRDEKTDLAVLKIDTTEALSPISWGNSDDMRVGDWVLAIGNPFGLGGTVTAGIISARARNINAGPYDDFLQTDASINRGNSGGPMFNTDGQLIGINTAIFSPTGGSVGIGFAIPANLARPVIDQIIEYGRTRRGWLGVEIQEVTEEIADSLGLDQPKGALVADVTPEGPAAKSGLETTDIILRFDGQDIQEMRELPRIVASTRIDKQVPVVVWRDGSEMTFMVNVGELEVAEEKGLLADTHSNLPHKASETAIDELGLTLSSITAPLAEEFGLQGEELEGVIITDVDPESEAWQKRLRPGDIIREFNQKPVSDPDHIKQEVESIGQNDRQRNVLIFIEQRGVTRFVTLKVKES